MRSWAPPATTISSPELPRIAIGYTWYAKRWQKSHLNTACKRLLLQHAFESLGCIAVEFHTDQPQP